MRKGEVIYRHSATVRITHWVNALVLLVLLMSGLQIFNAHPALYLGDKSDFENPVMAMGAVEQGETLKGVTTIFGYAIPTTGVFGLSGDADSGFDARGFPWWTTLPGHRDLAMGRRWHFFFAWLFLLNGLAYLLWSLASGHLRRDLAPSRKELGHIGASVLEHARLNFPKGEEAKRYNVIQKLTYLAVIFGLLPLVIATGLCMSPQLNADFPWLPEFFGGRQSARTLHFLAAFGLFAFFAVHIVMVVVSGFWNNMRSMITGRYAIEVGEGNADTSKA